MKFNKKDIQPGYYVWSGWKEDTRDHINKSKHIHWKNHPCQVLEVGDDQIRIRDLKTKEELITNQLWINNHISKLKRMGILGKIRLSLTSYPPYDKKAAESAYDNSLKEYNKKQDARHPAEKMDEQAFGAAMFFVVAIAFVILVGTVVGYVAEANEPKVVTISTPTQVVVTKYKMLGGKSSTFIVSYYETDSKKSGEFDTEEISFAVGDTITIDIVRKEESDK